MESLNFFGIMLGTMIGFVAGFCTMYIGYLIIYRDIKV